MRRVPTLVPFLAIALLPTFAARARGEDAPPGRNFVQRVLDAVSLGEPFQTDQVILIPLIAAEEPAPLDVVTNVFNPDVSYGDPEFPRHRYDVVALNEGKKHVLLLGGTVLEGGRRDRVLRVDVILPPGGEAEVRALPAASARDQRKDAATFRMSTTLAPSYLRKRAQTTGNATTVTNFVSNFLAFRNEGDTRESLAAINESTVLEEYCAVCHQSLEEFPLPKEGRRVVGFVAAVRGRIQAFELFGHSDLTLRAFEHILKGHTFAAAAVELIAKRQGVPIPGKDDADKTLAIVVELARDLLAQLRRARYREDETGAGQAGSALLVRTVTGTQGRAVGLDGRLVHLAVFPHDPFEHRLYSQELEPPEEEILSDPSRPGIAELERRSGQPGTRLTEAEQRLLDRLRAGGLGTGPRGPGR
jgi:hypothetical protein